MNKSDVYLGVVEIDGESVYCVFNGDEIVMEFTSLDVFVRHLLSIYVHVDRLLWVTDNDPVELDFINWYDGFGECPVGIYKPLTMWKRYGYG